MKSQTNVQRFFSLRHLASWKDMQYVKDLGEYVAPLLTTGWYRGVRSEFQITSKGVLYVITRVAPPAQHIHEFVVLAHTARWTVCVIAVNANMICIHAIACSSLPEKGHKKTSSFMWAGHVSFLSCTTTLAIHL
jgi:hypothetical protein